MTAPEDLPEDPVSENPEPMDEMLLEMFQAFDPATALHKLERLDEAWPKADEEPTSPPPPLD